MVFLYYIPSIVSIYYCDRCKDSIGIGGCMVPQHSKTNHIKSQMKEGRLTIK